VQVQEGLLPVAVQVRADWQIHQLMHTAVPETALRLTREEPGPCRGGQKAPRRTGQRTVLSEMGIASHGHFLFPSHTQACWSGKPQPFLVIWTQPSPPPGRRGKRCPHTSWRLLRSEAWLMTSLQLKSWEENSVSTWEDSEVIFGTYARVVYCPVPMWHHGVFLNSIQF
jgi:hypothetical protein